MRIIAGEFKGRRLQAPKGSLTRPTSDRVREAVFSILGRLDGFHVLDLYAGTGALGIEALSRGAASAVFVENAHGALACLTGNLAQLELTLRTSIIRSSVHRAHEQLLKLSPFDLVFCDPPWSQLDLAWQDLRSSKSCHWLARSERLVLEHPASTSFLESPAGGLKLAMVRAWGDSAVTIFERS